MANGSFTINEWCAHRKVSSPCSTNSRSKAKRRTHNAGVKELISSEADRIGCASAKQKRPAQKRRALVSCYARRNATATASTTWRGRQTIQYWQIGLRSIVESPRTRQQVCAELTGDDRCAAAGVVAVGVTQTILLCKALLATGMSQDQALDVFRNGVLALRVRSIGEAAGLEIALEPPGFRRVRQRNAARPLKKTGATDDEKDLGRDGCPREAAMSARHWLLGEPPARRSAELATGRDDRGIPAATDKEGLEKWLSAPRR